MAGREIPMCVRAMVNADFLITKGIKTGIKTEEDRKYVCIDCSSHALTKVEKKTDHNDHRVLQAFSCTRIPAYRVDDLYGLADVGLDVSRIAVYFFNHKYHIYPKSRKGQSSVTSDNQTEKNGKSCGVCLHCGGTLFGDDNISFCSIGCKIFGPQGNQSTAIDQGNELMEENAVNLAGLVNRNNNNKKKKKKGSSKKRKAVEGKKLGVNGGRIEKGESSNSQNKFHGLVSVAVNDGEKLSYRKRSRKGIPRRAPLF